MKYKKFGLVGTEKMLKSALLGGYAIPAFNFYNMESLQSIMVAASQARSPVILGISESALKYIGGELLMGMILGAKLDGKQIALHLDHGHTYESCKEAINLGFSSVMIDGSALPFEENIKLTKRVVTYAHKYGVSVEAELGALAGIEDDVHADETVYTNPDDVVKFVRKTGCDSLAVAIGTSHGAYKRHNESEELRFDILKKIAKLLPDFPLVLHGASTIPQEFISEINANGGKIKGAMGIPAEQIRKAVRLNICKVNIDSDARLAWMAAVRTQLGKVPSDFDPRKPLGAAREKMTQLYVDEIKDIMRSTNKV
ncbi:MAG: ketose-bisphosphate aldolase [Alphaproteobacteria bacterium]|nr:ketose-bisphosphate aldolase [Alphaproteobacteria bacterium]